MSQRGLKLYYMTCLVIGMAVSAALAAVLACWGAYALGQLLSSWL